MKYKYIDWIMSVEDYKSNRLLRSVKRNVFHNKRLLEKNRNCRCLVLLHLFYNRSWIEIREYLKNLSGYQYDVIITVTESVITHETVEEIRNDFPFAQIVYLENKGYDLWPFLKILATIDLNQYDIVFKIQSKSTKRPFIYIYKQLFFRRDWFLFLFDGILSARNVHRTIDVLYNNEKVGLVAAKNLIVKDPKHRNNLIKKWGSAKGLIIGDEYEFVAGTCFAVKAECLKKIQNLHFENDDFIITSYKQGMSFAHFVERYICISIKKQGFSLIGNSTRTIRRLFITPLSSLLGFFSAERLFNEPIELDDEWFFWQMDNKLITWKYDYTTYAELKCDFEGVFRMIDGAPYKYLNGDLDGYSIYCRRHKELGLPLMSPERFERLISSIKENGFNERNIIIVDENNVILDGQHRACILCKKFGENSQVRELRITKLKDKIKSLIPPGVMDLYHRVNQ